MSAPDVTTRQLEVADLYETRSKVPARDKKGNALHEAIDAQIDILTGHITLGWLAEQVDMRIKSDFVFQAAFTAVKWTEVGGPPPSQDWIKFVQ